MFDTIHIGKKYSLIKMVIQTLKTRIFVFNLYKLHKNSRKTKANYVPFTLKM